MISSDTPYKLAEIIRDTWPQLYLLNKNQNNKKDMNFTIYSKEGCPYCVKVQQVLAMANLEHVVYTMGKDFTREEFIAEFGDKSTFPQVILNDETLLGGCTDTVKYLKENQII
jgi:glutaredoxin